jgi:RNA recognition motif-containing protein
MTTTEQELRNIFNAYSNGEVTKLKMMRDFAFVHFNSREDAEIAMFAANRKIFLLILYVLCINKLFLLTQIP